MRFILGRCTAGIHNNELHLSSVREMQKITEPKALLTSCPFLFSFMTKLKVEGKINGAHKENNKPEVSFLKKKKCWYSRTAQLEHSAVEPGTEGLNPHFSSWERDQLKPGFKGLMGLYSISCHLCSLANYTILVPSEGGTNELMLTIRSCHKSKTSWQHVIINNTNIRTNVPFEEDQLFWTYSFYRKKFPGGSGFLLCLNT